jgi:hypothetical protein
MPVIPEPMIATSVDWLNKDKSFVCGISPPQLDEFHLEFERAATVHKLIE